MKELHVREMDCWSLYLYVFHGCERTSGKEPYQRFVEVEKQREAA